MGFMGRPIGAVDTLRLMTKGPGPPKRGASGKGASKSSMLRCQMSPVNGVLIGVAIFVFSHKRFKHGEDIGEARGMKP
jgi:hypothetical protein